MLLVVLVGVYRLTLRLVPLARELTRVLSSLDAEMAKLSDRVQRLDGRGVCPLLERRLHRADVAPVTKPEVR